jgi:hypothetical protein
MVASSALHAALASRRIEDYALIGNGETAPLLGRAAPGGG